MGQRCISLSDSIAGNDIYQQKRGMSHRLVRALIEIYGVSSKSELITLIEKVTDEINNYYDGEKTLKRYKALKE